MSLSYPKGYFGPRQVMVVGDVMVDEYILGHVSRVSPEAPVPVVKVGSEKALLGGAANVAANIGAMGGKAFLIGLTGADQGAEVFSDLLKKIPNVRHELFPFLAETVRKCRVLGDRQQIVRIDRETEFVLDDDQRSRLLSVCASRLAECQCVVISDYAKGTHTNGFTEALIRLCVEQRIPVIVDPKSADWRKYEGCSMVTPNLKELAEAIGSDVPNMDSAVEVASMALLKKYDVGSILVTRSGGGMSLISAEMAVHVPTKNIEVADVTGAGDTVVAIQALLFDLMIGWEEKLSVSNRLSGLVVGRTGTSVIAEDELLDALSGTRPPQAVTEADEIFSVLDTARKSGQRIVFTNGCFDMLHRGHVALLQKASELGDILIVGLNSDSSVKKLKGAERPVNNELDRAFLLKAISFVDHVVIFNDETPLELIKLVQPDILVKGGDYKAEEVVGREFAKEVVIFPIIAGYSTTGIIRRARSK